MAGPKRKKPYQKGPKSKLKRVKASRVKKNGMAHAKTMGLAQGPAGSYIRAGRTRLTHAAPDRGRVLHLGPMAPAADMKEEVQVSILPRTNFAVRPTYYPSATGWDGKQVIAYELTPGTFCNTATGNGLATPVGDQPGERSGRAVSVKNFKLRWMTKFDTSGARNYRVVILHVAHESVQYDDNKAYIVAAANAISNNFPGGAYWCADGAVGIRDSGTVAEDGTTRTGASVKWSEAFHEWAVTSFYRSGRSHSSEIADTDLSGVGNKAADNRHLRYRKVVDHLFLHNTKQHSGEWDFKDIVLKYTQATGAANQAGRSCAMDGRLVMFVVTDPMESGESHTSAGDADRFPYGELHVDGRITWTDPS